MERLRQSENTFLKMLGTLNPNNFTFSKANGALLRGAKPEVLSYPYLMYSKSNAIMIQIIERQTFEEGFPPHKDAVAIAVTL